MDEKILTNGTRTTTTLHLLTSKRKICMETLSLLFFQLTNKEEITIIPACTPSLELGVNCYLNF